MKRTTILPTLVAATLLAAACSSDGPDNEAAPDDTPVDTVADDDPDNDDPDNDGSGDPDDEPGNTTPERRDDPTVSAKVALQQFSECDAFLDYVHTEGAERVGAYGFNDSGWYGGGPVIRASTDGGDDSDAMEEESVDFATDDSADVATTSAPAADSSGGETDGSFSTTNVQVAGVDEPDVIKTDGERILVVANEQLYYVDVDGASGTRRGSVSLSSNNGGYTYGQEILVSGDRAFVISNGEGVYYGPEVLDAETVSTGNDVVTQSEEPFEAEGFDAEADFAEEPISVEPIPGPGGPGGYFGPTTNVVEIDLSDPDNLTVVNALSMDGRYISARAIGDSVRVAVTSGPQDIGFLYPSSPGAEDAAAEANRELVRQTTIEDWVPDYTFTDQNGTSSTGQIVACDQIHAPSEFAGFDMLSVVTLSLAEPLSDPAATTSVMATGDTVYASQDRMYISTNEWLPPTLDEQQRGVWEETYRTGIHRFSLPDGEPAVYEASGSVDGHLLNQFSMNDRDGTFFVATTTGTPWSSELSESQIVAMEVNGDELEQVGFVGGLGEGEQIFSVRYVDDVAYVVTFRQTDPFYVVDISSPTDMSVLGELKIPGVSNYLHPISDTLVLGVGQDATDEGFRTGSKVSLFDVSDPGNPIEKDVWTLPNSDSSAEFDHRAFLWWADTNTAVLPLTSWETQFSGAIVLNVTEDGITEQGQITHVDEQADTSGTTDCEVFTGEGLTEEDGDLFWITQEPGSQLQFCGPNAQGGAAGYYCDTIPLEEIENWFYFGEQETAASQFDLDGVEFIQWCWLEGGVDWQRQIQRTLVIDGSLWTMSPERLQANDLGSLERTGTVEL